MSDDNGYTMGEGDLAAALISLYGDKPPADLTGKQKAELKQVLQNKALKKALMICRISAYQMLVQLKTADKEDLEHIQGRHLGQLEVLDRLVSLSAEEEEEFDDE